MSLRRVLTLLLLAVLGDPALARPNGIFDAGREKATRATVTLTDDLPRIDPDLSPMLQQLHGVVFSLTPKDIALLAVTPLAGSKLVDARGDLTRIGIIHLEGRASTKRVELLASSDGSIIAQELGAVPLAPPQAPASPRDDPKLRVVKLDPERFRVATAEWPSYRGAFGTHHPGLAPASGPAPKPTPPIATGANVELAKPYSAARFHMDKDGLGDRFLNGRTTNIPATTRVLSAERMFVRLPRAYTPKRPSGLFIWINSGPQAEVPDVFARALDELNVVGIGIEKVGNDREVADRYQLALDALQTAITRFHIDPRRIYVSGISGGGRVSSMLAACFPDVFTGAVPIVGLSTYTKVPLGNSLYAPAGYERPAGKRFALLKSRRIAPITGARDFNHPEILAAAEIMRKDGLQVRVFDHEPLGHELPSADQFFEALKWVDQPAAEARARDTDAAKSALEKYIARNGSNPPADAKQRAELIKVTELAPWSDPAWSAIDLLEKTK